MGTNLCCIAGGYFSPLKSAPMSKVRKFFKRFGLQFNNWLPSRISLGCPLLRNEKAKTNQRDRHVRAEAFT